MPTMSLAEAGRLCLLNPGQREFLEKSVATNKRALKRQSAEYDGASNERLWDDGDDDAPDPQDVRASLARDQKMLDQLSPYSLPRKPYDLHKYYTIVKELDEVLSEGLLSDDQMNQATAHNVDAFINWTNRCVNGQHTNPRYRGINLVQARATLMRLLDPDNDDPNLTSPERLRPSEPVRVNLHAYYAGYDEIGWQPEDAVQAALEDLDEERYYRFVELKAADWSPALIKRELGFDDAMYEAAQARLRAVRDQMVAAPVAEPETEEDEESEDAPLPPAPDEDGEEEAEEEDAAEATGLNLNRVDLLFVDETTRRVWLNQELASRGLKVADLAQHWKIDSKEVRNYLNNNPALPKRWRDPAFVQDLTLQAANWFATVPKRG